MQKGCEHSITLLKLSIRRRRQPRDPESRSERVSLCQILASLKTNDLPCLGGAWVAA
jgi:hypothetical protein